MDNTFKIYKITNTANGKSYIGQTIHSIKGRWWKHKYDAERGSSLYFHQALRKYGEAVFVVEVIANAFKRDGLNNLEVTLISQHNTLEPNGYNLTTGGGASTSVSPATRRKMSLSSMGKKHSDETKRRMSIVQKKIVISKETREKMRVALIGFKHTEATKKKMSESSTGHKHSEETKRKISKAQIGKKHSEESKLKISLAQKGRKHSEESKKKIGIASRGNTYCLGHKLTEEHKIKLRDSARRGILNHNSKGLIHTPYGTFNTTQEAADNLKCAQQTISKRCNKTSPQWSKWYYEKPKSTENQQDPIQSQHNKCGSPKQNVSLQK